MFDRTLPDAFGRIRTLNSDDRPSGTVRFKPNPDDPDAFSAYFLSTSGRFRTLITAKAGNRFIIKQAHLVFGEVCHLQIRWMVFPEKVANALVCWCDFGNHLFHLGPPDRFVWMFTSNVHFFVHAF